MSTAPFAPPKLQKRTLKGHTKAVLCLAHSSERLAYSSTTTAKLSKRTNSSIETSTTSTISHPSLLLSGSEDGTARLWDLRTRKTAYCMVLPRSNEGELMEVTSVAFHPSILENGDECEIEADNDAVLRKERNCTVYAAASNHVYGYDLRYHAFPSANAASSGAPAKPSPILRSPHFDISNYFECLDEINQLSFSFRKHGDGGENFISAACDSGDVHICKDLPYQSTQQHQSTNVPQPRILNHASPELHAITSCSVFRPRCNEVQVASCGTDCTVKLWDVKRPRKPIYTTHIKSLSDNENSTQLCNPPFVHSLSWSPSGRLLAAGLGDGSCLILRVEGRRFTEAARLGMNEGGHASAVAAVCFPCFGLNRSAMSQKTLVNGTADDRSMISAGNDGNILFWDLGRDIVGCDAADPSLYLSGSAKKDDASEMKGNVGDITSTLDSVDLSPETKTGGSKSKPNSDEIPDDLMPSPPKVLFQISHTPSKKMNWLCCKTADSILPCSLLVADTTKDISVYSLLL